MTPLLTMVSLLTLSIYNVSIILDIDSYKLIGTVILWVTYDPGVHYVVTLKEVICIHYSPVSVLSTRGLAEILPDAHARPDATGTGSHSRLYTHVLTRNHKKTTRYS
jgi:hypothetical protein